MVMEFAVGRASQVSAALSFDRLEPEGTKWHWYKYGAMAGNYLLMMFYTTIGGWMLLYFIKMAGGRFVGLNAEEIAGEFGALLWNLQQGPAERRGKNYESNDADSAGADDYTGSTFRNS